MTGQEKYRSDVERYANHLLDRQKTNSDGILYVHKWGTLRLGLFSYLDPNPGNLQSGPEPKPLLKALPWPSIWPWWRPFLIKSDWKHHKLKILEHSLLEQVVWNQDYHELMNTLSKVLSNLVMPLEIKAVVSSKVTVRIHLNDLIIVLLVALNLLKTAQICWTQSKHILWHFNQF